MAGKAATEDVSAGPVAPVKVGWAGDAYLRLGPRPPVSAYLTMSLLLPKPSALSLARSRSGNALLWVRFSGEG